MSTGHGLDKDLVRRCIRLAADLGFDYVEIELLLDDDGTWYCLNLSDRLSGAGRNIRIWNDIATALAERLSTHDEALH